MFAVAHFSRLISDDITLTSEDGWFVIAIGHKAIANVLDELEKK